MTTTATIATTMILPPLHRAIAYGEQLAADIPAERFTHMPHPTMNHPAWIFGHLAIYPNRVLGMLGRDDLAAPLDGWETTFGGGSECVDDPTRYPDKDTLVSTFLERYRSLVPALEGVADEVLFQENPVEGRFREMFPTVGVAANFMCAGHTMMHLGQLSAWRRAIGLGPVF